MHTLCDTPFSVFYRHSTVTTERSDCVMLTYASGRHLNAGSSNQNQDVHKLKRKGFNKLIHVAFSDNQRHACSTNDF